MKRIEIKIEKEIINEYINSKKNIPDLSVMFSLSKSTIHRILKRNKIITRGVSEAQRDKSIIHNFYASYTTDSCYWAGFLAADGCLFKLNGRTHVISITQHLDELEHLKKYARIINFLGKITKSESETSYGKTKWARIQFASKEMFNDLINNFNIVENKSLILNPPLFEKEDYISSFIRGYFDGDGHILDKKYWAIGFTGTKTMLNWIKAKLIDNCGAGNPSIMKENNNKNTYSVRFCGRRQTPRIIKWLYANSTENTRLERKYKISYNYLR